MLNRTCSLTVVSLVLAAGSTVSAQTLDGRATAADGYGAPKWVQTVPASTTASFGDNVAGQGDVGAASVGDPSAANTGVELAIPYSALGITTISPFPAIKLQLMVTNNFGDNTANQNLPGLVLNTLNLGFSRTVNFTTITGDQFFNPVSVGSVTTAPTVDGNRTTAGDSYGAATGSRLQTNSTGYGDAGHGQLVFGGEFGPDGTEIDAVHIRRHDASQTLYVMVTGNLEANGNRITLFFDTVAGGQNRILNTVGTPLEGMGEELGIPANVGMTFDAGFEPDYMVSVNSARLSQPEGTPPANDQYRVYVDYATLPTGGAAVKTYCGNTVYPGIPGYTGGSLLEGDAGAPAIRCGVNNSNTAGVVGGLVGSDFRAPSPDYAYGSEIDAVYSKVANGKLYLLVAGNLNVNFAKLNLFFDCQEGGQNRLRGASQAAQNYVGNVDIDFGGLNRMGADTVAPDEFGVNQPTNGVKFDAGFTADYWLVCTNGPRGTTNPLIENYGNAAVLRTSGMRQDFNGRAQDYGAYDGGRKYPANFPMDFDGLQFDAYASAANIYCNYGPRKAADQASLGQQPLPFMIRVAIDNSNVAGVTPSDASGAGSVVSGVEIEIDLAELIDGGAANLGDIRVAGFISNEGPALNGDRYNYVANQVIGGLPLTAGQAADLGDPRTIDFSALAGNQFVLLNPTTVPGCGPADIGSSGGIPGADLLLNNNDFIVFIDYFFNQNPLADRGVSGGVAGSDGLYNNNDFIVFIDQFFQGCGG